MKLLTWSFLLLAMVALSRAAAAADATKAPEEEKTNDQDPTDEPEEEIDSEEEEEEAGSSTDAQGEKEAGNSTETEGKSHVVKRAAPCNQGWTSINGRLFIYISTLMTWTQAERNCISLGGTLASVHSAQEYSDIQKVIQKATSVSKETWIGGSDAQEDGVWLWVDGSSFGYSHWCKGEPNNHLGKRQDCLLMNYSGSKCWDDQACNRRFPSVCSTRK